MSKKPTYAELEQQVIELQKSVRDGKRVEKNLSQEKEKYQSILEGIEDSYLEVDLGGNFQFFNDSLCKLLGYSKDELIGRNNRDFVDEANAEKILNIFESVFLTGNPLIGVEWEFIRKDGSTRFVEASVSLITDSNGKATGFRGIGRDITERKRIEASLLKSEKRTREIFNAINDAVFLHPLLKEGFAPFVEVNETACQRYGYAYEELLGMAAPDITKKDDVDIHSKPDHRKKLYEAGRLTFEATHITKSGKEFPVEINSSVIELNQTPTILAVVRDISERKNAENEIRNSEARFRNILDHVENIPVQGYSADRRVIFWNTASEKVYGYSKAEAIGRKIEELIIPEEMTRNVIGDIDRWINDGEQIPAGEVVLRNKNGDPVPVYSSHIMHEGGSGNKEFFCIDIDLSQLRNAEWKLQDSEKRYRSLIENTMDGFFICKIPSGRFVFLNQRACEIYGYKMEEGLDLSIWEITASNDHDLIKERVQARLNGDRQGTERRVYTAVRKDGTTFLAEISSSLVSYSHGLAVQGTVRDVTEQERSQLQLQQSQKMEAIGTLAAGIAHDFNNMLLPLLGYSEMLKADLPADSPLQQHVDRILEAALRSKELVKQILAFSRQGEQEVKVIKLQPIVKESLKLLRSSLPTTIDLQQSIDPACDAVIADPTQIHQVIMNLATNAYHAMGENIGRLGVKLKQIRMKPGLKLFPDLIPGEYIRLTVSDTGTGIEKDVLAKIFDPYFTTKATGVGTGLGLSVVQGIVKRCHGHISVSSEPGKGTDVEIYLPIVDRQAEPLQTRQSETILGGNEKILLVDDEAIIVQTQKQMLSRLGYRVIVRTGSIDALEAFRANPDKYDLVVTDMTMPNMTGVQLAKAIKEIRPEIPIILCTGYSHQMNEEKCKAIGIQGFILKPVMTKELAEIIRNVLDKS
jgi:PAS domain S-box-containing protein